MARKHKSNFSAIVDSDPVRLTDNIQIDIVHNDFGEKIGEPPSLAKSIINVLNGNERDTVSRIAFESDPNSIQWQTIYKPKVRLIPDALLKRILIQDDLVAAIVQARQNHVSAFGRPRPSRFETGFEIEVDPGVQEQLNEEQRNELTRRIKAAAKAFETCGSTVGWPEKDKLSFSQWLSLSVRNAIGVGRIATEIIYTTDSSGAKKFHSFRNIDAGTIYQAAPMRDQAQAIRDSAYHLLCKIKSEKLIPERFINDEYSWVQVIDGTPTQVFTGDECKVYNFYPAPDIELGGYPITPLDTVISAVTTHLNITAHNKLYFQNGRATRGMLVLKSEDNLEKTAQRIRQQFMANINNVNNSWRMPVFSIGRDDDVVWQPIDSGGRDMEFQYLADANVRVILTAFMMSPEELPGWSYLSRGTNNQALAESNQEWKLQAARDLGIRPLLAGFQDFINKELFPLIDPGLAKISKFKFVGLDAETAEKESVRIQQDMPVHMTFNQVLEKVEKKPIATEFGGDYPLNPQFQAVLDKFVTVGEQKEYFFGIKGASKDPNLAYFRDPFFFQWRQILQAERQMQMQVQQMQATQTQAVQTGGSEGAGQKQPNEDSESEGQQGPTQGQGHLTEKQKTERVESSTASPESDGGDLTRALDQALDLLSKSEKQLPPSKRRLLHQQKKTVADFIKNLEADLEEAKREILDITSGAMPRRK